MRAYGVNELRKMYLEFFESKGHLALKSFSLVPKNDNSLLLINAGMAPLKPYFTGQEVPPRTRVTTCQKCIRTGDIENVGKTARHGTFFEMLGNFSFGDYFKTEAIHWSWEFLTEVVGLDANRLYPSVSAAAFRDLFTGLSEVSRKDWAANVPNRPILVIAGDKDPVGSMGKGPTEVAGRLLNSGHDVILKLYPGMRHEILNETGKKKVWQDVLDFLNAQIG